MSNRKRRAVPPGPGHGESRWSADDALRIRDRLCEWLRSRDGADAVMVQYHRMYDGEWPAVMTDPYLFARQTARESAGIIADADLIWCDPPMVALLAAASDTYPATSRATLYHPAASLSSPSRCPPYGMTRPEPKPSTGSARSPGRASSHPTANWPSPWSAGYGHGGRRPTAP